MYISETVLLVTLSIQTFDEYCPTNEMVADIYTKPSKAQFVVIIIYSFTCYLGARSWTIVCMMVNQW